LRAYTPRDQKAVQAAAETFRSNPKLDTAKVITELEVGEALVSFLDEKGKPGIVERAYIIPPASQIGPISDAERSEVIAGSLVAGVYEKAVDRESAYESLKGRVAARQAENAPAKTPSPSQQGSGGNAGGNAGGAGRGGSITDVLGGLFGGGGSPRRKDTVVEAIVKSAARSIGSQVGREIIRGVLGSILKR
jgi:DNA helicase HerA-like ATPase